ncbi:hypothetical protein E2562_016737 [Oryza meyeriana var. granulata]|uniref:Uncharacterized protein n=1 Tax=Oryza meyeriana var. granulata TaxID=110450 RepID=A0A6G1BWT3_9ORYZ|nr:hypothetical protein E2562_016737 [Oryza meyeriana var. granulata]
MVLFLRPNIASQKSSINLAMLTSPGDLEHPIAAELPDPSLRPIPLSLLEVCSSRPGGGNICSGNPVRLNGTDIDHDRLDL